MTSKKETRRVKVPAAVERRLRRSREEAILVSEFLRDMSEFRSSASPTERTGVTPTDAVQIECQLTKDYHRVEKGLSLAAPKRPFGAALETRLVKSMALVGGSDDEAARYAGEALAALRAWNTSGVIDDVVSPVSDADSLPDLNPEVLKEFFAGRTSVRNFDRDRAVPKEVVAQAAEFAQGTPSVCNRRSARLHVVMDPDAAARVLAEQNGNSGFRDTVPHVAVVSVDRRLFSGAEERNQRWIDGGLFAMTFVWALHGLGVGSCMLNWSVRNQKSVRLREIAGISPDEDIICMIAFGYPALGLRRARSPRRPIESVLRFVE